MTSRRSLQRAETRRRLVAAAREEFDTQGFEGATLRSIAKRVGVAVGTVFVHFSDKRDLLHEALFSDLESVLRHTLTSIPEPAPVRFQLEHVAFSLFDYYERRPGLSRTLLKESIFADDPWRERFQAQVGLAHAEIVALLMRAKKEGHLVEATPAQNLAGSFFANYYFALISWVQGAVADGGHRIMFRELMGGQLKPWLSADSEAAATAQKKRARTVAVDAKKGRRP